MQGYCPVCEDFWPLAEDQVCPKHTIALEGQPPEPLAGDLTDSSTSWVEVARFSDTLACQPPRIRLEAEGIPTMIDGERMGNKSMYYVATGGVGLRVPEKLAAEARVILSQTWSATAAALDIDEWDDWDEFDEEVPGKSDFEPDRSSKQATLFLIAMLGMAVVPILLALAAMLLKWLGAS